MNTIQPIKKPPYWNNLAFNQKIYYYGKNLTRDHSIFVDKIKAKDIVKEICGDDIEVPKIIKVIDNIEDLKQEDLNPLHIIKGSHGSKFNVNIKEDTKLKDVISTLKKYNVLYNPHGNEIQYSFLTPKFFIEEKVDDFYTGKTGEASVFMIRCIYSKPVSIGIVYKNYMNNYYIDWKPIKIEIPFAINTIKEVNKMIELAEKLSKPFEFVRVDFYLGKDRKIYFSEFTFTPLAGKMTYPSYRIEYELGKSWI